MTRTVRLEGLSVSANPRDLRLYFAGLEIPPGGVTILGGERGLAYLDFTTLADAQSAVRLSGRLIRDSIVYIYPSSVEEMERSLNNYEPSSSSRNGFYEDRNLERPDSVADRTHLYLRITAGSLVGNKSHIRRQIFEGLDILDIRNTSNSNAIIRGDALVKFSNSNDAYEGKRRYRKSKHITVIWSSEAEWFKSATTRNKRKRPHSRSPHKKSRSPLKRPRSSGDLSNEHDPGHDEDCHVHVANLNSSTKRDDLKKYFNLRSDDEIKFLYDENGHRTKECFVMFKDRNDYKRVLKLDKVKYKGSLLFISPISKSRMKNLLAGKKALFSHYHKKGKCIYLRNFPSSVAKSDIRKFFTGFSLNQEDISLLCDRRGVGLGEVIVTFSSEEDLRRAQKLHRKKFQGKEIPLRLIPEEKLHGFLCANFVSLMPDPYDCVTQEDDLLDEDINQENDTTNEDADNSPDEDTGFHQTDNTHEFVTQEDDAPDRSALLMDDASDSSALMDDAPDSALMDDAPDNSAVNAEGAPDNSALLMDDAPDNSAVNAGGAHNSALLVDDAPDNSAVHADGAPDNSALLVEGAPENSAVHADGAPDNSAVQSDDAPSSLCISNKDAHVGKGKAIPVDATSSSDGLGH